MGRGLAVRRGDRDGGLPRHVRCEARSNEKGERGREGRFLFSFQLPRQISLLAETASPFCGVLVSQPSPGDLEQLSQDSQSLRIPARQRQALQVAFLATDWVRAQSLVRLVGLFLRTARC